ncbi:transmembrane protein 125 [Morone saxatilis]|uniref:transmembrane protein 125 n=1 Tax=Morone saxatilis TaxID=34816 RepID=UPI0015E1ED25|nr:transmembrane protein 125 [Morone saxatilis]
MSPISVQTMIQHRHCDPSFSPLNQTRWCSPVMSGGGGGSSGLPGTGHNLTRWLTTATPEMQTFYQPRHTINHPSDLYLDPTLMQRRVLEDQVELWWFREPRHSLLCYCASVALIVGLGLGGVGLLSSTTTSLSGEWRLGVGTTLCLLALAVLLKQLLSSAIQDMNCVHSRRRIDQLKSGGRADPALILAVGLAVMLCGTVLLCVATIGNQGHDSREMLVSSMVLMAAGTGMALAVVGYSVLIYLKRRREQRRMMMMRMSRVRRLGSRAVRVFSVSGGQTSQARRETSSSRTSLI